MAATQFEVIKTVKNNNTEKSETKIKRRKDGNPKWTRSNKQKGVSSLVYPIKNPEKFKAFCDYFFEQIDSAYTDYKKYVAARNYLLVCIGNNTAYRISDIVRLKWCDLLGDNDRVRKQEKKTKKFRTVFFNDIVKKAVEIFFDAIAGTRYDIRVDREIPMDNYIFCTCKSGSDGHMTEANALDFVKKGARAVGIEDNVGTHTLRKNFVYWTLVTHKNDQNVLYELMRLMNHSNPAMTFLYATITEEETYELFCDISDTYKDIIKGIFDGKNKNLVTASKDYILDLIKCAYDMGQQDANEQDYNVHMDNLETLEELLNEIIK